MGLRLEGSTGVRKLCGQGMITLIFNKAFRALKNTNKEAKRPSTEPENMTSKAHLTRDWTGV